MVDTALGRLQDANALAGVRTEDMKLIEHVPGTIWLAEYPVRFRGMDLRSRMTVVRLRDGRILLHSPCDIDEAGRHALEALGEVAFLVAPGSFHHLHVPSAQAAFPGAETYICPGVERKQPELEFDWILGDRSPAAWERDLDQALVRGNRWIWEVAFFHRTSGTLILVDLVENYGDGTPGVHWGLELWWKAVFHMWNHPKPAPEYQMGWRDRKAARASLERILEWDFQRVILAHGDLIETDAQAILRAAWKRPLES